MILYLKSLLDRYIHFVPIFMLLATLVTNFVDYSSGAYNYVVVGNSVGYSIATNSISWYLFNLTNKKYCWLTRNIPIGLLIVNGIDIIGSFLTDKVYSYIFNIAICLIIIILAVFFKIKKSIGHD